MRDEFRFPSLSRDFPPWVDPPVEEKEQGQAVAAENERRLTESAYNDGVEGRNCSGVICLFQTPARRNGGKFGL